MKNWKQLFWWFFKRQKNDNFLKANLKILLFKSICQKNTFFFFLKYICSLSKAQNRNLANQEEVYRKVQPRLPWAHGLHLVTDNINIMISEKPIIRWVFYFMLSHLKKSPLCFLPLKIISMMNILDYHLKLLENMVIFSGLVSHPPNLQVPGTLLNIINMRPSF